MKKLSVLMVIVFVLSMFSFAGAKDLKGMFNVSPFAGIGLPMGDMSSDDSAKIEEGKALYRKLGIKFGVSAEYFFTPNIGAGVDFMYAIFGEKDMTGVDDSEKAKLHTILIGVHGKYVMASEGKMQPYFLLGAGLAMNKIKPKTGDEEFKIGSKPYINGGIGGLYWVNDKISVFAEAGFDYMLTKDAKLKDKDGKEILVDGEALKAKASYFFLDLKLGLNIWFGAKE